ncbi:MAG: DUF5615 family PIN-like protein [Actinobacteria bacterium]|nr:DUF5615 family PIN-like protein [Actinomycetota bacterium]
MIPSEAARQLRESGVDASAVGEHQHLRGSSDHEIVMHAIEEKRAVVTFNVDHFLAEGRESKQSGMHHFGIVLIDSKKFGNSRERVPELVSALRNLAHSNRRLENRVTWLHKG